MWGSKEGDRNPITPEERGMRGSFLGGRSLKAFLLATLVMDSTTFQGWPCYVLYSTGDRGAHALPSTDIVIACK